MERICTNLLSVFQVLDAITGRPLEESGARVECSVTRGTPPVYKGAGWYLFLHPTDPAGVLIIRAYGYRTFRGTLEDFVFSEDIHKIYMQPDDQYPLSNDMYGIQGTAEPESTLFLICQESAPRSRLAGDYEAGAETVLLSVKSRVDNGKMDFRIQEGEQTEFMSVLNFGKGGKEEYSLAAPLSHSYHQDTAVLVPAKRILVDASGVFACYWMRNRGSRAACICELWNENGTKWKKLELQAGIRLSTGRME